MFSFPFELAQSISNEQQKTTLWMGELEPWMDEQYIQQLWFNLNEKVMVKVIRDKVTGISAGYAFVDFGTAASARLVMNNLNGVMMPNLLKQFKLNWASGGGLIDRREDRQPEYSIFVGDLSPEITEIDLSSVFQSRYLSCKSAKIMTDPRTGITRGYGFVRFAEQLDQQRALIEMQGYFVGSRAIRVSIATPKNRTPQIPFSIVSTPNTNTATSSLMTSPDKSPILQSPLLHHLDLINTTVFVGGLSAPIREDELRQYFQHFGEIVYVKIPPGKGCGFVQYVSRTCAELAIQQMNGYQIGNSRIRLSWGRSQNEKTAPTAVSPMNMVNVLPSSLYNSNANYPTFSSVVPPQQPMLTMPQQLSVQQQDILTMQQHNIISMQQQSIITLQQEQYSINQNHEHQQHKDIHYMQHHQSYASDLNFLSADDSTTDDMFASVTRSLLSNNQGSNNNDRKVNWRLNQIYAQ